MDANTKANIANSPKMLSVWFMGAVGSLWTAYAALPPECAAGAVNCLSQAMVVGWIQKIGLPAPLLTALLTALGYYFRVKAQSNITPAEAAAKSADAPTPP